MSEVFTPDGTGDLVLSYTNPTDDDGPPAASQVAVPLEGLAEDLARVAAGKRVSESVPRQIPLTAGLYSPILSEEAQWYYDASSSNPAWTQRDVTSVSQPTRRLVFPLHLAHGALLTRIDVTLIGVIGDSSTPATMPNVELVKYAPSTGTFQSIVNVDDVTTVPGHTYDARHVVSILQANLPSGDPYEIDRETNFYEIRIKGAYSTHAAAGLRVVGVAVTATVSQSDQAGV